jgi:Mismatch repair ATPase (MutS family)
LVSVFIENEDIRENVVQLLKRSYDSQRLVQKFALGRGDPDDLICLSRATEASKGVRQVLSDHVRLLSSTGNSDAQRSLESMISRLHLDGPIALAERILAAIDEEGLLQKQRIEDSTAAEAASLAQRLP